MPDVHISEEIAILNPYYQGIIDPYDEESIENVWLVFELPQAIIPSQPVLFSTEEVIHVPEDCIANIYLRSTFARLGLVCPTTVADPGFEGTLTLEVFNAGLTPILIRPGDALFHYIFTPQIGEQPYQMSGRYQHQRGVTLPKALRKS